MSEIEKIKADFELKFFTELKNIQQKLSEKQSNLREFSSSLNTFLLGIWTGIMGNLFASYLIEFQLLIGGNHFIWIILGLIFSFISMLLFEKRLRNQIIKPIKDLIFKFESSQHDIGKEMSESEKRIGRLKP
jgi:hypothetical protein